MRDRPAGMGMEGQLLAVVTVNERKVIGDIPIFLASSVEEMEQWALTLSRITRAMVHELDPEVLLLIRH
ncbi:MAG: capping complex subunit for YIEGIA [Betaproteobacteria bacterium]